jgi:hypothetical protein
VVPEAERITYWTCGDEQIQPAIVVEVHPGAAHEIAGIRFNRSVSDPRELKLALFPVWFGSLES